MPSTRFWRWASPPCAEASLRPQGSALCVLGHVARAARDVAAVRRCPSASTASATPGNDRFPWRVHARRKLPCARMNTARLGLAQAGPIAHLAMRLVSKNALEQTCGVRADGLRPVRPARRHPFQTPRVGPRAVLVYRERMPMTACAWVRRHSLALVEDLDHGRVRAHFHHLMHQFVRNAVLVAVIGAPTRVLFSFPGAQAAILRPTACKSASRPSQMC